jgi:UDP-N-acetylglucosamine--N-acetylmuramyl-(pentapeptide) pyrophosphoryl-undecaprenol N-acetylglucosamine transferase
LTVALAARTLGIPIVIHEQTLQAGLANRIIGKFAKHICISWETSRKYFPGKKIVLTGNLLRQALSDSLTEKRKNEKTKEIQIYITGGSAGAHAINLLVEQSLTDLLEKYILVHQTGDAVEFGDYSRLYAKRESLPEKLQKRYLLTKFIDPTDVGKVYAQSDLVIGRSGVNTITELLITHKPCLLIPIPHGQKNEQMDNALFLKEQGLATILPQKFATAESFSQAIDDMTEKLDQFVPKTNPDMSLHLHAAEHLVQLLQSDYEKETGEKPQT